MTVEYSDDKMIIRNYRGIRITLDRTKRHGEYGAYLIGAMSSSCYFLAGTLKHAMTIVDINRTRLRAAQGYDD